MLKDHTEAKESVAADKAAKAAEVEAAEAETSKTMQGALSAGAGCCQFSRRQFLILSLVSMSLHTVHSHPVGNRCELISDQMGSQFRRGCIAFLGTVEFQPGVWVGVKLDEPYGKNNGSVQGKQYFEVCFSTALEHDWQRA